MSLMAASPVLVPLATTVVTTLAYKHPRLQNLLSYLGMLVFFGFALALVEAAHHHDATQAVFGGWGAPFGIEFVIDRTSAIMLLITAIMGLASLVFLASDADCEPRLPFLLPLMFGVLAGVGGSFATADLFNLYVWFEVMLISAVGLLAIGGRTDQLDATFKYFVLNLYGTLLLLFAVGMIYASTGHLNYSAIAQAVPQLAPWVTTLLLSGLMLAILVKAGAFPMYAWLPASYHTLPAPVLALFAGLLTKVGAYVVLRFMGDVFSPAPQVVFEALGWIAAGTMLFGVLGAAYHWDMRRILAVHIVSQIGYLLLGVALASQAGNAAMLFYTLHNIVVKANLFLIAAMIWRLSGDYDLRKIGGLYKTHPMLGILFLISALALVGIPPLSGFWSKYMVLHEAIQQGRIAWTAIALVVSALTLYSMAKIWMEAFWKAHPDKNWSPPAHTRLWPAWVATLGLTFITLLMSFYPQPLIAYVQAAAQTLGAR